MKIFSWFLLYSNECELLEYSKPMRAFLYTKSYKLDLLTLHKKSISIVEMKNYFFQMKLGNNSLENTVLHFFYEWGVINHFPEMIKEISETTPLVIELQYEKQSLVKDFSSLLEEFEHTQIRLNPLRSPSFEEYKLAYEQGVKHLLNGDCYQFNLTFPFEFSFDGKVGWKSFASQLWKNRRNRGAYAHLTYLPTIGKMIISNSPECLFQINGKKEKKISVRPIKGTINASHLNFTGTKKDSFSLIQKKMGKKNLGELNMITDLLRNDLISLGHFNAQVTKKCDYLFVPGLIHQYSLIKGDLPKEISIFELMFKMFPSGSITGAPKKKVMEILHKLEAVPRGIYCGSTLHLQKFKHQASVNIRTAYVDFVHKKLTYGAGGGVTLLSKPDDEYKEMLLKVKSFIDLITNDDIISHRPDEMVKFHPRS